MSVTRLNKQYSIVPSMTPGRQMGTQKSVVNPREFSPTDWTFKPDQDVGGTTWLGNNKLYGDNNMRFYKEPWHSKANGHQNPLTGDEPIAGHVNYTRNPLDNEKTNLPAYYIQQQTRVSDNMNPFRPDIVMPSYQYSVNVRPGIWQNIYEGSTKENPPYQPFMNRGMINYNLNPRQS